MSGTMIGKVRADGECDHIRLFKMVDGRLLLCQGQEGSPREQIIDLTRDQADELQLGLLNFVRAGGE